MVRHRAILGGVALACVFSSASRAPVLAAPGTATRPPHGSFARLPLRFEENRGQWDARVRYAARAGVATLFLTDDGATLASRAASTTLHVEGAHRGEPVPGEALPGLSSYFVGSDPSRWVTGAPAFGGVSYDALPGVRELFHGDRGALEVDFVVAPHVSPSSVVMRFDPARSVALGAGGELVIDTSAGALSLPAPRLYQRQDGQEVAVRGAYRVEEGKRVAFDIGAYDPRRELVIDPVLAYATYLGGSGSDYAYGVAVDGAGAMYVAGATTSVDFPTKDPAQGSLRGTSGVFVAKLDAAGQALVYATYLGGSGSDSAYGVAVDADGAAYVTGATTSVDFPTVGAAQPSFGGISDAFVAKLAPSGAALVYSTYLGGSDRDYGYGIAVDAAGAAYVAGSTYSADLPTTNAPQASFGGVVDVFAAKLDPVGSSLAYLTYLGGDQDDEGRAIAVDRAGAAYVVGYSSSLDYPTAPSTPYQALDNGDQNVVVTKLAAGGGTLVYSTYLGGSQSDEAAAVAVDADGAAYVAGFTTSPDFPTVGAEQPALLATDGASNAFVTKLASSGTSLVYSTFLGGQGSDVAQGVAVDPSGDAYVTGTTASPDFPLASPVQATNASLATSMGTNAFATELAADGSSLVYSTYLGGSVGDTARAVAVSASGAAYLAGYTVSPDFPTVAPLQPRLASLGGDDAFVAVVGAALLDPDAGAVDAGSPSSVVDASTGPIFGDAAEPPPDGPAAGPSTVSGGGCSCHVARALGRDEGGASLIALAAGVGALVFRKRRRLA